MNNVTTNQTSQQIADRYIARRAILNAMKNGRHITFLDSQEFKVSEMHTEVCYIRRDIQDKNLPYVLKDKWVKFGPYQKKCKEYWLEEKPSAETE